jgi:hypothetical protein
VATAAHALISHVITARIVVHDLVAILASGSRNVARLSHNAPRIDQPGDQRRDPNATR